VIDTHAHLDLCADPDAAVGRAQEAGVRRIVTVGTTVDGCRAALALTERHTGVFAALGVHPHEAGGGEATRLDEVRQLLSHEKAVAVGETGLDFYRDYAPHEAQRQLFDAELALAEETGKPVVVHTRAAPEATVERLTAFRGTVVLHCFSAAELLEPALSAGWYVSFAGNVTYPNARDLRAAARAVPAERILAETDTPYLAPQPRRGRPNEPAFVVHTLTALAEARAEDPAQLELQIEENATRAFALP
jgi:TatD DNase family protein